MFCEVATQPGPVILLVHLETQLTFWPTCELLGWGNFPRVIRARLLNGHNEIMGDRFGVVPRNVTALLAFTFRVRRSPSLKSSRQTLVTHMPWASNQSPSSDRSAHSSQLQSAISNAINTCSAFYGFLFISLLGHGTVRLSGTLKQLPVSRGCQNSGKNDSSVLWRG